MKKLYLIGLSALACCSQQQDPLPHYPFHPAPVTIHKPKPVVQPKVQNSVPQSKRPVEVQPQSEEAQPEEKLPPCSAEISGGALVFTKRSAPCADAP